MKTDLDQVFFVVFVLFFCLFFFHQKQEELTLFDIVVGTHYKCFIKVLLMSIHNMTKSEKKKKKKKTIKKQQHLSDYPSYLKLCEMILLKSQNLCFHREKKNAIFWQITRSPDINRNPHPHKLLCT